MASGDGIDSIELESTVSNNRNAEISSAARTSDDNDRDPASGADGRSTNQEVYEESGQIRSGAHRYAKTDKEKKIGHRRVGEGGEITYKKIQTTQIMGSIQLGIQHTVGSLASKPKRDLLMMDFWEIESISFPPEGSSLTPAHHYSEFRFKIYAPIAFRYFRDLFGIQPDDFMMSMCSCPLRALSNPGASGSIFYLTDDDEFIIKTVQHKEGEFLQKLLPGYYMNLNQNPRTLLPKFFGLYCFQCNSKNVRLVVMNNLLPSYVKMHLKYDLKGSTYKRKASKIERGKSSPTYKDLDFMEHHPNGIFLEADTYNALIKTIQRDCTVLESFKIMDYSLLVGVHNLDLAFKEKQEERRAIANAKPRSPRVIEDSDLEDAPEADQFIAHERDREERERERGAAGLNRSSIYYRSVNRQRLVAHSTAMESIQAESEPIDEEEDVPPGGIPARSEKGERLLLFIGIIDILQSYRLKKKLEHTFKSIIHDGDTVSVCRPSFYAQRFQNFMAKTVFKKIPSLDLPEIKGNHRKFRTLVSSYIALKHSPSKRKSLSRVAQRSTEADSDSHPVAGSSHHHHHLSNSSQKSAPSPVVTQSIASVSNVNKPMTTNVPTNIPPLKQKNNIMKSKVPPPVPPRGSPKTRKGQSNRSGNASTGTPNRGSPTGSNQISVEIKHTKNTLQLEEHVPKFGERLSPSNVRDWLELNFSKSFLESDLKNTTECTSQIIQSSDILKKDCDRGRRFSKRDFFQRQSSLSQSGRSSVGSIVRRFPPIVTEYSKPTRLEREKRAKKEYLDYIDMVIRDDDEDDGNLITSLSSFLEVKKEIESNLNNKKLFVSKNVPVSNTKKQPVKKIKRRAPSIIMENSCVSQTSSSNYQSLDTNAKNTFGCEIRQNRKLFYDNDDNYSRDGELV